MDTAIEVNSIVIIIEQIKVDVIGFWFLTFWLQRITKWSVTPFIFQNSFHLVLLRHGCTCFEKGFHIHFWEYPFTDVICAINEFIVGLFSLMIWQWNTSVVIWLSDSYTRIDILLLWRRNTFAIISALTKISSGWLPMHMNHQLRFLRQDQSVRGYRFLFLFYTSHLLHEELQEMRILLLWMIAQVLLNVILYSDPYILKGVIAGAMFR